MPANSRWDLIRGLKGLMQLTRTSAYLTHINSQNISPPSHKATSTQKYPRVGPDSSVGLTTRYGLDGLGIESRWGGGRFFALVQTGPGAHPASYTIGIGSFLGVKRPGRGVEHPPHLAPRLKKE